jgi:hypothetical protein
MTSRCAFANWFFRKHLNDLNYPAPRAVSKLVDQVCREMFFYDHALMVSTRSSFSKRLVTSQCARRLLSSQESRGFSREMSG